METISLEISNQYKALSAPKTEAEALFRAIEQSGHFPIQRGELSVVFVSDETIAQVHADFMDDPTPTDVITFPANAEMESAGEIIVSVEHAQSRALE
ncbi:MAG: rRNA maturation RNase YbeY, partial [Lentimonas sp.]